MFEINWLRERHIPHWSDYNWLELDRVTNLFLSKGYHITEMYRDLSCSNVTIEVERRETHRKTVVACTYKRYRNQLVAITIMHFDTIDNRFCYWDYCKRY